MFAERRLLGILNTAADSSDPRRGPSGACEQRHCGDRHRGGEGEQRRQPGAREVVRAVAPEVSASPAPITVALLTALVRKKIPPERRTIQWVGAPAR
jgi:hypothetical protein